MFQLPIPPNLLLFSHPFLSDSLWHHGLQQDRPPCPSLFPEVCSNSCPSHRWCHPAISSSDALFSFGPQPLPASGTFPMSRLFTSGGPNPGAYSNSCPSHRWCHPTISSSVVPFSSCLQSFPASVSFLVSQFFAFGGQSIGASASVLPMNILDFL